MTAFKPTYRLDVDQPKRNVFVTQLNDRDEDEEDVKAFPIVKENAAHLIEQGINTLQKTLLLKKEVEVGKIDNELAEKREEFRKRMEACSERQIDIQKKQQKMRDRVSKFEKFIKENEAKRRRAIQKYQNEVKLKEQKSEEHELFLEQLALVKARHEYLRQKLVKYKIYEAYLNKVIEILPAHYLEVNDSMLASLMMRHRTLSDTNQSLVENLSRIGDEIELKKQEVKEIQSEHDKRKFSINSQLSIMKKEQEVKSNRNQDNEQKFSMVREDLRSHRMEFGMIMMAVENLAEKCRGRLDPPMDDMDLDRKLTTVEEYLNEKEDVARMVQRDIITSAANRDKTKK